MLHFQQAPGIVGAASPRPTLKRSEGLVISKHCGDFEILVVKKTPGSQSRVQRVRIQGSMLVMYPGLKALNLAT